MNELKTTISVVHQEVSAIFVHPNHYTSLIQKKDRYLEIYDELTMEVVARSQSPLSDLISVAFTLDFNSFLTLQTSNIISYFQLAEGYLQQRKYPFHSEQPVFDIAYSQDSQLLVAISSSKIHFMDLQTGTITKQIPLHHDLGILNACHLEQDRWLLTARQTVYSIRIADDWVAFTEKLDAPTPIVSIFKDYSLRGRHFVVVSEHSLVLFVDKVTLEVKNTIELPDVEINVLNLYHPSPNTSATDKHSHQIYLILHGVDHTHMEEESSSTLYIYEIAAGRATEKHFIHLMRPPKSMWTNENISNCLLIQNDSQVVCIDLIGVINGYNVGKQWACLGYKFQPLLANEHYEEREEEFQTTESGQCEEPTFKELNEWSYSLFNRESVLQNRVHRLNCFKY